MIGNIGKVISLTVNIGGRKYLQSFWIPLKKSNLYVYKLYIV